MSALNPMGIREARLLDSLEKELPMLLAAMRKVRARSNVYSKTDHRDITEGLLSVDFHPIILLCAEPEGGRRAAATSSRRSFRSW